MVYWGNILRGKGVREDGSGEGARQRQGLSWRRASEGSRRELSSINCCSDLVPFVMREPVFHASVQLVIECWSPPGMGVISWVGWFRLGWRQSFGERGSSECLAAQTHSTWGLGAQARKGHVTSAPATLVYTHYHCKINSLALGYITHRLEPHQLCVKKSYFTVSMV